ncbi:hypothetical protein [Psychrobacter piscatorii]|uniref:Uncharacterized protein n=1 Tax=Psychrobacter piscatorii TaxID=554343 RepID=A0A0T6DTA5_9GAMM|nr:hypothetical protein [Psychrobacter piscatorii]KRU23105.1 hypothetical protein AS194_05990 [Psychrobacter piscatorii]
MKDNHKKSKKNSSAADSSADNVDEYLQTLGNEEARERRYYSQEQPFSADEMTRLVNEERLNVLLAQSDAFLSSLNGELRDFDDEY